MVWSFAWFRPALELDGDNGRVWRKCQGKNPISKHRRGVRGRNLITSTHDMASSSEVTSRQNGSVPVPRMYTEYRQSPGVPGVSVRWIARAGLRRTTTPTVEHPFGQSAATTSQRNIVRGVRATANGTFGRVLALVTSASFRMPRSSSPTRCQSRQQTPTPSTPIQPPCTKGQGGGWDAFPMLRDDSRRGITRRTDKAMCSRWLAVVGSFRWSHQPPQVPPHRLQTHTHRIHDLR